VATLDGRKGVDVNFNSLLIGSADPARLVAYYTRLFGEPGFNDGGYSGWMIGNGAITVGPHSEVHGNNPEPGRLMWNIESTDVKADFARLQTAGATVVREPYTFEEVPGSWIATFSDPDGNYFQLVSPMMA
jgi:predicted enzyme related to lactoylglutathione lyase